jgi:tetratricopeptide (TPR) repeat protein
MNQVKLLLGSLVLASLVMGIFAPGRALAWELFRSENDHVADGNELLRAGDHAGALREYDLAARELPSEPGVHLDRGLALMAAGDFGRAREAFMMAADPPATAEIRSMAHYNIGLTYYREGDALAAGTPVPGAAPAAPANPLGGIFGGGATPPAAPGAPAEADHDGARRAFREAADAFRDSLRQVPGNRDAGWNLELALRRITEEDEAEEREREENEESEEGEDGEESDESGEDGEESDDSSEEGEPGDEESEGGEGEEESEDGEESSGDEGEEPGEAGEEPGEPGEDGADDGSSENEEEGSEERGDPSGTDGEAGDGAADGEGSETEAGGTMDRSLSPDAERVLDALENSEENLAAARARGRGEHASRRVERDW